MCLKSFRLNPSAVGIFSRNGHASTAGGLSEEGAWMRCSGDDVAVEKQASRLPASGNSAAFVLLSAPVCGNIVLEQDISGFTSHWRVEAM